MSRTSFAALAGALVAGSALAAEIDPTIDADGDGLYSFTEMTAAVEGFTEEMFLTIDTNGDGALDREEVEAAQTAGLWPMTDG